MARCVEIQKETEQKQATELGTNSEHRRGYAVFSQTPPYHQVGLAEQEPDSPNSACPRLQNIGPGHCKESTGPLPHRAPFCQLLERAQS